MSETPKRSPRNVLPDLIIPALAVAFTIYYLTTITEVPWSAQASAVTVSALLLLAVLAFAIRTIVRISGGQERLALEVAQLEWRVTVRRLLLLLLTVGYVFMIDVAGFTITTLVFVFIGVILLSSIARWRSALAVALACSILGYVVFIHFFQTRFPRGPVEELLRGLS